MADTTYAVVDKSKKAKIIRKVCESSEADETLYAAVDMTKKKKNRNITTAETTLSDVKPPAYYNTVALEEPAFERADPKGPESDYSMITAENIMAPSESSHISEVKNLTTQKRTASARKDMAAIGQNDNTSSKKLIACIFITMSITFLITLICLVVLFYEISTLKASQGSMEQRVNNLQQSFHQDKQSNISAEITGKLSEFQARNDEIHMQLNTSIESDRDRFAFHHAASCAALPPSSPPGYYWIGASADSARQVYCTTSCDGVPGRWARVAYLNMTDCSQQCPSALNKNISESRCTCGKRESKCNQVHYPTVQEYSQLCGRINARLMGPTDGFIKNPPRTIDKNYLDGISLTHGSSPRQHIWSFVSDDQNCCSENRPEFIPRENYFCDRIINQDSIAWDGNGCSPTSNYTPPWFHRNLTSPTTDDVEMRLCVSEAQEDIRIQILELYVK